jgi:hypothetical protein
VIIIIIFAVEVIELAKDFLAMTYRPSLTLP